jgi:protein-tyrosine phosphatase
MPDILTVCTANVCRSPFAQALLDEQLNRSRTVEVVSAGTRAESGHRVCEIVKRELGHDEFAETHRSQALRADIVSSSALILTAEMSQRTAVLRLDLKSRQRTFSFLEAASLTRAVDTQRRMDSGQHLLNPLNEQLPALVARLDAARGLARPKRVVRPHLIGRKSHDAAQVFSIPDGHNLGRLAHRRTLAAVSDSADELAEWLSVHLA